MDRTTLIAENEPSEVIDQPRQVSTEASQRFQDWELIRRSKAGDTEAFGELVTKYRIKIFNIVYSSMVRDQQDAWDLAQAAIPIKAFTVYIGRIASHPTAQEPVARR